MDKWKIPSNLDAAMECGQISELATALMDTWVPAGGADLLQDRFLKSHEHQDYPSPAFLKAANPSLGEQVPMDDLDFSFWDGEHFYSSGGDCSVPQMDQSMPPLLEELADEMAFPKDDSSSSFPLHNNPTLAELNANLGESVFECSSGFQFEDSSFLMADTLSRSFPVHDSHFLSSPASSAPNSSFSSGLSYLPSSLVEVKQEPMMSSSCPIPSRIVAPSGGASQQFLGIMDDKFPLCPQNSPASDSFFISRVQQPSPFRLESHQSPSHSPGPSTSSPLRMAAHRNRLQRESVAGGGLLSSSAPPDVSLAARMRGGAAERPSSAHSPLSGFSSLSLSNDDESGSFFDDDDDEEDFSSDDDVYQYESDEMLSTSWPTGSKDEKPCRKHRYFWQYNLQSRGSKSSSIIRPDKSDPHILHDAFDPVFSEECALPVKHSGKARRGDGNDLTPDPRKLFSIGMELKKLNRMIYNVHPPDSAGKPLSRKEKNKLASRVCRLKKKAQHEANKIKLYGLQQEHKKLMSILIDTRELLKYKMENLNDKKVSNCSKKLETFVAANEPHRVAGNTAAFVNEVLDKISKGESDGGLSRL